MQRVNNGIESALSIQKVKLNSPESACSSKTSQTFRQVLELSMNSTVEPAEKISNGVSIGRNDANVSKENFFKMIGHLQEKNIELNRLIQRALDGENLDTGEMLTLQGKILNFTRDITAVSKIVESMVSNVKTLMQTQI